MCYRQMAPWLGHGWAKIGSAVALSYTTLQRRQPPGVSTALALAGDDGGETAINGQALDEPGRRIRPGGHHRLRRAWSTQRRLRLAPDCGCSRSRR